MLTQPRCTRGPYFDLASKGRQKHHKFKQKFDPVRKILICHQKVSKKGKQEIPAKSYLIPRKFFYHQKVSKKTEIQAKISPYTKHSNLPSKVRQRTINSSKKLTLYQEILFVNKK